MRNRLILFLIVCFVGCRPPQTAQPNSITDKNDDAKPVVSVAGCSGAACQTTTTGTPAPEAPPNTGAGAVAGSASPDGPTAPAWPSAHAPSTTSPTAHAPSTTSSTPAPPAPAKVEVQVRAANGFDNRLRVKNLAQLASALETCVGFGMTMVDATMILPASGSLSPPTADGRFAFLPAGKYAVGTDVLAAEGVFLLDPARAERFGADADALSASYLRALETVANVVAHNCTPARPLCDCASNATAGALLRRCLPAFSPGSPTFRAAEAAFAAQCAAPNGQRQALASLLASYAFAAKN